MYTPQPILLEGVSGFALVIKLMPLSWRLTHESATEIEIHIGAKPLPFPWII